MAKARIESTPPPPPPKKVILELSEDEAAALWVLSVGVAQEGWMAKAYWALRSMDEVFGNQSQRFNHTTGTVRPASSGYLPRLVE